MINRPPSDELLSKYAPLKPLLMCNELLMHQTDNTRELWIEWQKEACRRCKLPYWSIAWPAGVSLARYIIKNSHIVENKVVLDFCCAGGTCALAAAYAGAKKVIANDNDADAIYVAKLNAAVNNLDIIFHNTNLLFEDDIEDIDVILVADMFYDGQAADMTKFLFKKYQEGIMVLIADPHRPFTPKNTEIIQEEYIKPASDFFEGKIIEGQNVRILKFV